MSEDQGFTGDVEPAPPVAVEPGAPAVPAVPAEPVVESVAPPATPVDVEQGAPAAPAVPAESVPNAAGSTLPAGGSVVEPTVHVMDASTGETAEVAAASVGTVPETSAPAVVSAPAAPATPALVLKANDSVAEDAHGVLSEIVGACEWIGGEFMNEIRTMANKAKALIEVGKAKVEAEAAPASSSEVEAAKE